MHNNDDLSWFLTCGPHCSCPREDEPDHDPEDYDGDPWDDCEYVERLARFAEAGGWEVGNG